MFGKAGSTVKCTALHLGRTIIVYRTVTYKFGFSNHPTISVERINWLITNLFLFVSKAGNQKKPGISLGLAQYTNSPGIAWSRQFFVIVDIRVKVVCCVNDRGGWVPRQLS